MNNDIERYLTMLGMGDAFKERVNEFFGLHAVLCQEPAEDLFVSEYVEQSGERRFERLVIFGESSFLEVADFLAKPSLWVAPIRPPIAHVELTFENYNFSEATSASRLSCVLRWIPIDFELDLKASGQNCDKLKSLISRFTSAWKATETLVPMA